MTIETVLYYIDMHGYLIIFLLLFFGIVGIPAPEESLLFLIGILIGYKKLSFGYATCSASLGVFLGMIVAYILGKHLGTPFLYKYGKYIGLNTSNLERVKRNYMRNAYKTILFGLYMPGVRQISPYFAGIVHVPFQRYMAFSLLGTLMWTIPIIALGYYTGEAFHINPKYAPLLGLVSVVVFLVYILMKKIKKIKRNGRKE